MPVRHLLPWSFLLLVASGGLAAAESGEQRVAEGDRIAVEIRYGIIDRNTLRGPDRFLRLDRALAASDALAADFFAGKAPDAEDRRRLTDRMSALFFRRRAADAVALYEAFLARDLAVPPWAKRDVAGSYLELRQPASAASLYREVIAANPDDFEANLGLFYALVESEEIDLATAHIDAFAARLPERRHRDGKYNGERLSSDIAADQARIYGDRLQEAQARIGARTAAAPFNGEARQAAASLALARGWPRQGEELLHRIAGSDPDNAAVQADLAEVQLGLQNWPAARESLGRARGLDPDNGSVRRAGRTFELHDSHEFYTEAGYGRGQDSAFNGNRDWSSDSYLYSRPQADRWRFFVHNFTGSADFDRSNTKWIRTGVGLEWRWLDWRLTGEVNDGSGEKAGLSATARWKADDHWTFHGAAESVSNQIPLRAVQSGVRASRASAGADWQANESRKLSAGVAASDFSDDNRRSSVNVAWFERWTSGPRWMFETTLGGDASHNTRGTGVSYFNPKNDRSLWLAAAVENLVWRNYERSFRQRLALTGGHYWQQNFPSGSIEAIEYGHRWELERDLSVRYGIGRSFRPYDGTREARSFANLSVLWRF
jgi:biofilm PGA synthesis protein PgaA